MGEAAAKVQDQISRDDRAKAKSEKVNLNTADAGRSRRAAGNRRGTSQGDHRGAPVQVGRRARESQGRRQVAQRRASRISSPSPQLPLRRPPRRQDRSRQDLGATTKDMPKPKAGEKVNINTASKDELDVLPGIGPVRAQAIIDGRPFKAIEDVMKVKGIKEVEFGKIKEMITVK